MMHDLATYLRAHAGSTMRSRWILARSVVRRLLQSPTDTEQATVNFTAAFPTATSSISASALQVKLPWPALE